MLNYMSIVNDFQRIVLEYYRQHGRHDLPWRQPRTAGLFDPYAILVSEIMLQQTQVPRVLPKYEAFLARFPSFEALAAAPLADVLIAWNGLGYNRRAKFLWQAAQTVSVEHHGQLPDKHAELVLLPGVGPNTAGAIMAYAFNKPVIFIETNIRTVYIHHFFADRTPVRDKDIADKLATTLPDNPRQWYWALMDYGTYLKQTVGNVARHSAQYTRQSAFVGSRRQLRGQVLRALQKGGMNGAALQQLLPDERLAGVLSDLVHEAMVTVHNGRYSLHGA